MPHEIVIQIKEKWELHKGEKNDIIIVGWQFLDKTVKKKVLDEAGSEKEVKDVFRQMKQTAREQQEDPETARRSRRLQYLRRMIGSLKSIQREAKTNHFLPGKTLESLHKIIAEIEQEIEE